MNVTLPENKEINKKRIILYSIAIFICILSIIIIIGIQILGNDVVDEFFGINKITKKTEEQEEELKANFETLFQNQLENKNNNEVKKIDDDKEIVYTNYQKNDRSTGNYELNINIPYINIKNKTVQDYNDEIKNTFEEKAEEVLKSTNNNIIYTVKYEAYIENNILSLIIYSDLKQNTSAQRVIIQTFNFNLETNKKLTLEDIIKIYELNQQNVQNKINEEIKSEEKKSQDLKSLGYNVFSRNIDSDIYKIENVTEFFVHNNNLYIIFAYGNDKITSEKDIVVI
ncbi:MAG: hypothetical protein V8R82_09315 [Clostridia bacterium]